MSKTKGSTNCTDFSNPFYCRQPGCRDYESTWNGLRNFYVAVSLILGSVTVPHTDFRHQWNIYTINKFVTAYYNAPSTASSTASDNVESIVSIIDPVSKTNVKLNNILTALSVGLALIP